MPAYDKTWFEPPAPLAYVTLHNCEADMVARAEELAVGAGQLGCSAPQDQVLAC